MVFGVYYLQVLWGISFQKKMNGGLNHKVFLLFLGLYENSWRSGSIQFCSANELGLHFFTAQLSCKVRWNSLRKPADMPLDKDVKTLWNFVLKEIKSISEDPDTVWDKHTFIRLLFHLQFWVKMLMLTEVSQRLLFEFITIRGWNCCSVSKSQT